jgi:hypothetical protein
MWEKDELENSLKNACQMIKRREMAAPGGEDSDSSGMRTPAHNLEHF